MAGGAGRYCAAGALAVARAAQRIGFQLHQAFGGKADHLAQECRVGALLQKRAKGDLVVGHRDDPRVRVAPPTPPLLRTATVPINRPACARLVAVAPAGRSAASYTTRRDTTKFFERPLTTFLNQSRRRRSMAGRGQNGSAGQRVGTAGLRS